MIKVLSLTLGLGVGLILFARVAFELSFDTFFDQVEDLYSVHVRYNDDKTGGRWVSYPICPDPGGFAARVPRDTVRDGLPEKVRGRIVS